MIAAFLAFVLALGPAATQSLDPQRMSWAFSPDSPAFDVPRREVTNWRTQSMAHLALDARGFTRLFEPPQKLPRCIRLNNYWCVKSAGWRGELATDAEGHVAFASATEGAAAAALLLRRYYRDFERRSAMAIVSRWAPNRCGALAAPRVAGKSADGLATRGLRSTLRAKYLAKKTKAARSRASRVAAAPAPMLRAPSIAIGFGEKGGPVLTLVGPVRIANLTGGGGVNCPGETTRIQNYAARASAGLAAPDADLQLFDAAGEPTPRLAAVMANMASVEIGPMEVDRDLIEAGIARARELWSTRSAEKSEASTLRAN